MPTILIVEDFDPVREVLSDLLRPGYDCRAVRTAEEGLRLLEGSPADVVITDLKLPGMSRLEFLKEMGRRHPGIPVLVITGGVAGMFERDFLDLGAFGYLLKPYAADEVETMVRKAVEYARAGRRADPDGAGGEG